MSDAGQAQSVDDSASFPPRLAHAAARLISALGEALLAQLYPYPYPYRYPYPYPYPYPEP